MKKVVLVALSLGLGLMSCEKPELIEESMNIEVKGWSSDIFIENNNSKTSKSVSTSKSEEKDYTIEVYGEQDIVEIIDDYTTIYESLIIEGDIENDYWVMGTVVYHIDPISNDLIVSINRNDREGNETTKEHLETDSYEIVFK